MKTPPPRSIHRGETVGNCELIAAAVRQRQGSRGRPGSPFPELAVSGYPPKDLLLRGIVAACGLAVEQELCGQPWSANRPLGLAIPRWNLPAGLTGNAG